jgi:aspartate/methionine/tyrosine aminotransferase
MSNLHQSRIQPALRTAGFCESVIREMSRIAAREGSVNLAQGFPDFAAPAAMKRAAGVAIEADINQYAVTWGAPRLRRAVAERTSAYNGIPTDADEHVTVTCGATEAMIATMLATVNPGDEVIVFEPFYENYGPDCTLSGAVPKFVRLRAPDWSFDPDEVAAAFGPKTKAILINTPHNPTGKVFGRGELEFLAALCVRHDVLAITDEIYEYILFDGTEHVSMASLPGMRERTVTISGLSKTWSATGWRIGWCIAPAYLTDAIRKVHDFLTVGAPAPLQEAAADALAFGPSYFEKLRSDYEQRRDILAKVLVETGFEIAMPKGAYYIMAGIGKLASSGQTDTDFAMALAADGGVATVPGSSFFGDPRDGHGIIRFCFAKQFETLEAAAQILRARLT